MVLAAATVDNKSIAWSELSRNVQAVGNYPRFQKEAMQANLKLAAAAKELGSEKAITPAQLALAWVLTQGKDVVPISGTKRVRYLEENMGVLNVGLSKDNLKKIAGRLAEFEIVGERYTLQMMALVQRA
jgi:aryl-alcohol dehydrogenase-like predicted oxidoreductase